MAHASFHIRPLNAIEQAFTLSNEAAPLSVACVLQLAACPGASPLTTALALLQARHPLLQAGIVRSGGALVFQRLSPPPRIPLSVVPRTSEHSWREVAENAINTTFDRSGPLMKCWHVANPADAESELIVCFHHAIIDGVSARLLLHELLSLAGEAELPDPPDAEAFPQFPPAFRGWNLRKRLLAFLAGQLKETWLYRRSGAAAPFAEHSRNAVFSLRLPADLSRKIALRAGREGIGLNSLLLAVITQVVLKHKYPERQTGLVRTISFANLRGTLLPPVSGRALGCYISMVRLTIPVLRQPQPMAYAAAIQKALFRAGRRGEVFLMSQLSKYLVRLTVRFQPERLGVSALSFIGRLDLEPRYGPIHLNHVMAFITNNRYGPELSAFGKVLFGCIGLDFTCLTAETSPEQAEHMVEEIRRLLEDLANAP